METENRLNAEEPIEEVIKEAHKRRVQALVRATKRGQVNLLISDVNHKEPRISIPIAHGRLATFFATAVYIQDITVAELDIPDTPMEMLIYDRYQEQNPLSKYKQLAKYLPDFIASLHPKASNLPVYVFRSFQDLKAKKPVVKVKFQGNLLTAQTDTSRI